MELKFIQIKISEKEIVLDIFKEAAIRIAKRNIDHWQYWKNPPIEKIQWVVEGILHGEFYFLKNSAFTTLGMVRILKEDLLYWGDQAEKALYIHSLVVKEAFEGQGIGQAVLTQIQQDAKNSGYPFIRLDADANNPTLCAYYEKQGFMKVGEKPLNASNYNLYQKAVS